MDIDTEKELKQARKWLLKLSGNQFSDSLVSKYFNRKISSFLCIFLLRTPIRATHITILSFITGIYSSYLFIYRHPLTAGIFAQVSSILDSLDGQLARIKLQQTEFGAKIDTYFDFIIDTMLILSLGYYYYMNTYNRYIWVIIFFAILGIPWPPLLWAKLKALFSGKRKKLLFIKRDIFLLLILVAGMGEFPLLPLGYIIIGTILRDWFLIKKRDFI